MFRPNAKSFSTMNHPQGPPANALAKRARSPDTTTAVRSSTQKRTRIAGSKNLKNHEWVLVHQHFLRRNKENKGTIFVIHGVEHRWDNVRRKVIRASAALKAPLEDSESLAPLPWYIELRSPSPELLPLPPVAWLKTRPPLESSPQRPQDEMGLQSSLATSETQSHNLILEDKEQDIEKAGNAFLGDLRVSEILNIFRRENWNQHAPSLVTAHEDFILGTGVSRADTLRTFVNRFCDSWSIFMPRLSHLEMVLKLICEDQVSTDHFLETVVRKLGGNTNEILQWLASKTCILKYGARALGAAAHSNNFEAVDALLSRGVDINATVLSPHSTQDCHCQIRVIDYARLQNFDILQEEETSVSDEMIAYLLDRGAEESMDLRMCLFGLLVCVLRQPHEGLHSASLMKVRGCIRLIYYFAKAMSQTESFLETWIRGPGFGDCLQMARDSLFDELLWQSTEKFSVSPLTTMICNNIRWIVFEKLLEKTDNINAYCNSVNFNDSFTRSVMESHPYEKVPSISPLQAAALLGRESVLRSLLENGADVNCSARGSLGVTALQAICRWETKSLCDHNTKARVVDLLLNEGADVNAAPAWKFGLSALQAAASVGDVHVASLLVSRGADVNAPACKHGGGTALAMAAKQGHAYMVQFLLKAGAAIPPASPPTLFSDTTYEETKAILRFIRACASELAMNGGSSEGPPRDYHEYEAEWEDDPTYDKRD